MLAECFGETELFIVLQYIYAFLITEKDKFFCGFIALKCLNMFKHLNIWKTVWFGYY